MLTVTLDRNGRTWYGRRLYEVRIENKGQQMNARRMRPGDAMDLIWTTIAHEVAEGRPFKVVDKR